MRGDFLRRSFSTGLWGAVCGTFGALLGAGSLGLGAALLASIAGFVVVLLGPNAIATLLLVGSPTVFGFPNQLLRPLPLVTMERLLLFTLAATVFLRLSFGGDGQLRLTRLESLIGLFLGYALLNMLAHTSHATAARDGWLFIQYAMPMGAYLISRRIAWRDDALVLLLLALSAAGAFLALTGIAQARFGITLFTMNYQSLAGGHGGRAVGTFANAHTFTATLFIFLTLTLMQLALHRDALLRALLLGAIALMLTGMILGQSRAPWLGAALGLAIVFVRDPPARPVLIAIAGGGALAAAGLLWVRLDQLGPFLDRVGNIGTLLGRLTTWSTALNMLGHNPLFGIGFGADAYAVNKAQYLTALGPLAASAGEDLGVPHSEYLHVASLLGIIGLGLFLAVLAALLRTLLGAVRDPCLSALRRRLALYLVAVLAALLFNSVFSDTFVQDYFWLLLFFLAGIVDGAPAARRAAATGAVRP